MSMNKSGKIRSLYDAGLTVAEISKLMGIRYQFAYNVVSYYATQKELEVRKLVAAGTSSDRGLLLEHR